MSTIPTDSGPEAARRGTTVPERAWSGFSRIVCGIDPSTQAAEALRQASMLADDEGRIVGVSVWDPLAAAHGSYQSPQLIDFLRDQAAAALLAAHEQQPRLQKRLVRDRDIAGVLETAAGERADLLAVGSRGQSRPAGIALGSVATAAVHHSHCSVLVARRPPGAGFPDRILYAGDGSPDSQAAATIAGGIAARYDSTLVALHVESDESDRGAVTEEAARLMEVARAEPVIEIRRGRAHRRIAEAAADSGASLVILGSRGLTGVRALGSVSERVAHKAPCSVLIVRRSGPASEPL